MISIFLTLLPFLQAGAAPISFGVETTPTVLHTIILGLEPRNDCSGMATRTLYQIIRSCALTILACVYRAVHQNIPDPAASKCKRLFLRVKTAFCALLVPEMMICWATRQWIGAKVVSDEVNSLHIEGLKWTRTHGQFAQMGGFGRKDDKRILYPPTLIKLLKEGQLDVEELKLTRKEIEDKSKGDILSKAVILFQTTWFVFECIARLQQKLPITELEVVTLAFATFNLLTYLLWWNKPLDVLCPIYLRVRTPASQGLDVQLELLPSPEVQVVAASGPEPLASAHSQVEQDEKLLKGTGAVLTVVSKAVGVVKAGLAALQNVLGAIKRDVKKRPWWVTIWKRLIKQPFLTLLWPFIQPFVEQFGESEIRDYATHVSPFYALEISLEASSFRAAWSLCWIVGACFGAIHFLSWDANFQTPTEKLLWRISSIALVGEPLLLLLPLALSGLLLNPDSERSPWLRSLRLVATVFNFFGAFVSSFGLLAYIPARFCVLVLAIMNLFHLPPDTFRVISWTSYIPHL